MVMGDRVYLLAWSGKASLARWHSRGAREDQDELIIGDLGSVPGRGNSKSKGPEMVMNRCA